MDSILLPFLWALNGVLAVIYILAENLLTVGLLVVMTWMLLSLKPFANAYYAERIKVFLLVTRYCIADHVGDCTRTSSVFPFGHAVICDDLAVFGTEPLEPRGCLLELRPDRIDLQRSNCVVHVP